MFRKVPIFSDEMAKLLISVREKAHLSQMEVAERMGLSPKSGYTYISHLEKGRVKNPPIWTILLYLSACGESWPEFFKQLDIIDFKLRHEKMISQLPPPATQRKIQRDAMRYEIGVEFPSKEKEEIDFARLKKIIKEKVERLVNNEEITLFPTLSPNRVF
jgi:transcriptional regulator with XRE-family HTH domain